MASADDVEKHGGEIFADFYRRREAGQSDPDIQIGTLLKVQE